MEDERRKFLKQVLGVGVVGVGTLVAAKTGLSENDDAEFASSNGVVIGHSPKKEILYKKTFEWDVYYKSAY